MSPSRLTLPLLAIVIYVSVALIWLGRDRRLARTIYQPCSIQNTAPEGLSLAFAYLNARTGTKIGLLTRPISPAYIETNAVVLRVAPHFKPVSIQNKEAEEEEKENLKAPRPIAAKPDLSKNPLLTEKEERWVREGGRLILALGTDYGPVQPEWPSTASPIKKVYPIWPGVNMLDPPARRVLGGPALSRTLTIFSMGDKAVISRLPLGSGDVVLVSCFEIFQNASLGKSQHLELLESLISGRKAIYFDEYVHGFENEAGMLALLAQFGFGPLLTLLCLLGLIYFWRCRVRIGPAEEDYAETRTHAVDFVDSLAQFYNRALPRRQALLLYYNHLVHHTGIQSGLRGEALQTRVHELTKGVDFQDTMAHGSTDINSLELQRAMTVINNAFSETVRRTENGKSQ